MQVSNAEWDAEERTWKYRVQLYQMIGNQDNSKRVDVTHGRTVRSIRACAWLERSLLQEFHGALLLPNLSIALGVPDLQNVEHEVDPILLTNWFSDVLNGVRGQGELMIIGGPEATAASPHDSIMGSESMEAFLYRTTIDESSFLDENEPSPLLEARPATINNNKGTSSDDPFENALPWKWTESLCVGVCQPDLNDTDATRRGQRRPKMGAMKALDMLQCTSRALGDAQSFDQADSFVDGPLDMPVVQPASSGLAIHNELLEAEKVLIWDWRKSSLTGMEKLRVLQEQEKQVGAAWKRFAISISNLFAYEKDIETARLGDSKSRRELHMPYKKLQKSAVDDCLRSLARQKFDRAAPALESIAPMLGALVADLSAILPSVHAYLEAVSDLSQRKQKQQELLTNPQSESNTAADMSNKSLRDQLEAGFRDLHLLARGPASSTKGTSQKASSMSGVELAQIQTMEYRILTNEGVLKEALTAFCAATPVRNARIAHKYFQAEAIQTAMLQSAATTMRTKISVASKDSLSKMIHRHHEESKEDQATEMALVKRIVYIGKSNVPTMDATETDESAEDSGAEQCLAQCRERMGRWDAKLAMGIMEVVGVKDANVRVEETTRDLRMVRKYAISLREHVQKCTEALDILKMAMLQGAQGDIRDVRHNLMKKLQRVFAATFPETPASGKRAAMPSRSVLEGAGIDLSDVAGWIGKDPKSCGKILEDYLEAKDSSMDWLLENLGQLLKDYNERVECIESFVYMECVGIQLEKHCSQERASKLEIFEKKTDITSAMNVATRKRMPKLVDELKLKLDALGGDVTHTMVKEAKEAHLESKTIKQELHDLAVRRLTRSRETSTERVIALMAFWAKDEESTAAAELKLLKQIINVLEESSCRLDIESYSKCAPRPKFHR